MKKWPVSVEDYEDLFPLSLMLESMKDKVPSIINYKIDKWAFISENRTWRCAIDSDEWNRLGLLTYNKLKKEKDFLNKVREKTFEYCNELIKIAEKINKSNLSKLTNKELWDLFSEFREVYTNLYSWGAIPVFVDFIKTFLSDELRDILKSHLKGREDLIADYFIALTNPKEEILMRTEEKSILNIAKVIFNNKSAKELFKKSIKEIIKNLNSFADINNLIEKHTEEFGFFGYCFIGPSWKKDYFVEKLSNIIKENINPETKLKEIEINKKANENKKKNILNEIRFSDQELKIIKIAEEFAFLKIERKDIMYKSHALIHPWLVEVAKRFDITVQQLRSMTTEEMKDMLLNNKVVSKKELDERIKFHMYVLENNRLTLLSGKQAKDFYDKTIEKIEIKEVNELKGECACKGKAKGIIKIIKNVEDMSKMNKGDILISPATNPNLVPAMIKAAAIVTDEGGITCHAAIVSRELNIPCITGTKIVTKAFKDGDLVEVDATKGIVKRL